MQIEIVTPAPRGSRAGNRITALRWALILRRLGHRVVVVTEHRLSEADLVVAVHARRSHAAITQARRERPGRRIVVALSGTDLYVDLGRDPDTTTSLQIADRIIALHPGVPKELPPEFAAKTRVILQSASAPPDRRVDSDDQFRVVVVGHLRAIKDPFRAAAAVRRLPTTSRVLVTHIGEALTADMGELAGLEERDNPRFRWLGPLSRRSTLHHISAAHLLALTSREEGGANVISEAIVCGVPVVASRNHATVALFGEAYPGLFPFADTDALTALFARAENERDFLARLGAATAQLRPQFHPDHEARAWRQLLRELATD